MSRSALVLSALLSLAPAAASAAKRKPVPVPKTSAADAQAFDQTFDMVLLLAGRAYLKNEPMPDPESLAPLLASFQEPQLGKAKLRKDGLARLVAGAECVQSGPAAVALDVYRLMVHQAADDLQAGLIVEQEFAPDARSGRPLDPAQKALVKACQDEARDQAYDRRGFYQKCLGRRRSEAVYLAPERLAGNDPSRPADLSCGPVLEAAVQARAKLPSGLSDVVGRKLQETRDQLVSAAPGPGDFPSGTGPGRPSRVQVPPAAGLPAGGLPASAAPASSDLRLDTPPLDTADLSTGVKLAKVAKANEIGFTGYCYSYVKAALEKMGIVDREAIANAGAAAHAKLFAQFVEKNPALLKRKLRRVPSPSWPVPIGTIVVWSPGACGYSAESGHIEIITRLKPPQACSDGCQTFQTACFDRLGSDPARARAELPKAQEEARQAQSDYDAKRGQAQRAVLRKKKVALAAIEKRLEPQVAAYIIQR